VTFDRAPGLVAPCFDEKPLSLRHPKLRSTFGRALLALQPCGTLTGGPKIDNFRHVDDRWCPDASAWIGTDPLIEINYADTVALDHLENTRLRSSDPSRMAGSGLFRAGRLALTTKAQMAQMFQLLPEKL